MVRRLGLGKNNHLTYASLALNPRNGIYDCTMLQCQSLSWSNFHCLSMYHYGSFITKPVNTPFWRKWPSWVDVMLNLNSSSLLPQYDLNIYVERDIKHQITQKTTPHYRIYHIYSDRQAWANSIDPDETPQNAASHLGLHCLPLIQQFLDTTSGSELYWFKF